jgi:esterase/lipase
VNPLATLQQKVRAMAWLPGFFVRKRVAAFLEHQALEEYAEDYRNFNLPGETKGYEVGSPVLLRGRSRQLGIVLIHGYLAAPQELAELAAYLHNKGFWVYQVRLRGHGTSPEDLATRTAGDWLDSVDRGYALMSALCKRVVVGGFSLGGGLALDAAMRIEGLAGVFAVCPPLRLRDRSARLAPVLAVWNKVKDLAHLHGHKKEFIDISPEHPHINYLRLPVQGMWELERFMKNLEERLPEVRIPALLLQSDGDPTVEPAGTALMFEQLGSIDKTYRTFALERHGILLGEGSEQVFAAIGTFIDRLRQGR